MKVDIRKEAGCWIARPKGEYSTEDCQDLVELLTEKIAEEPLNMIMDLSEAEYISSWVLAVVIRLHYDLKDIDRRLTLVRTTDDIKLILIIAGVDKLVNIYETLDEALEENEKCTKQESGD